MENLASQKLEEIDNFLMRNYIEPYRRVNREQLSEGIRAKIELAESIKHILSI